jgi:hypothetical protein
MDLNSSFASRIVREELTETEEGGSVIQTLYRTNAEILFCWLVANKPTQVNGDHLDEHRK